MSKSIHTTIASARRDDTRTELGEPDIVDFAALAKKLGYKRSAKTKRQGDNEPAVDFPDPTWAAPRPNQSFKPNSLRGSA